MQMFPRAPQRDYIQPTSGRRALHITNILFGDALANLDSGVLHWLTQSIPTPVQQETANHDSWFSWN
jgi:hypothetical protein